MELLKYFSAWWRWLLPLVWWLAFLQWENFKYKIEILNNFNILEKTKTFVAFYNCWYTRHHWDTCACCCRRKWLYFDFMRHCSHHWSLFRSRYLLIKVPNRRGKGVSDDKLCLKSIWQCLVIRGIFFRG